MKVDIPVHSMNLFQKIEFANYLKNNKMYEEAINVARRSLRLSIRAGNEDYVKMNNDFYTWDKYCKYLWFDKQIKRSIILTWTEITKQARVIV